MTGAQAMARLILEAIIALTILVGTGYLVADGKLQVGDAGWIVGPVVGYWFARTTSASAQEQTGVAIDRALGNHVNLRKIENVPAPTPHEEGK